MNDFDLIIFDCDGTLVDSEPLNNKATLEALADEGFHYTLEHAYEHWMGKTLGNIMLAIQMETGREVPREKVISKYIRRVHELQDIGIAAVPGALEFVEKSSKRFKVCVASNGERSNVINAVTATGFMPYFRESHVFTKIQVKNPKPYPDLFLFAANEMGADPARTLVIEDSATGVMAGKAAGMTVWGFTGTAHAPENRERDLQAVGANRVFARFIHMAEMLGL